MQSRSTLYISISIVGVVIAALYFSEDNNAYAALSLFIMTYVLCGIHFLSERRFYRRHGAILASFQFLLLPFVVLIVGSYISSHIFDYVLLNGGFTAFGENHYEVILNIVSLSLIIPVIIFQKLFYKYISGRWSGIAINRKIYGGKKMPILIGTIFSVLYLYVVMATQTIDLVAIFFPIIFLFQIIKYVVTPSYNKRRRSSSKYDDYVTTTPASSRLRRQGGSSSSRNRNHIPLVSRSGQRNVSTSYKNAREITSGSQNNKSKKTSPSRRSSSTTKAVKPSSKKTTKKKQKKSNGHNRGFAVSVDEGRELRHVKHKNTNGSSVSTLKPAGNLTKEDLSCMFCYEEIKENDTQIILCPHCKYPGHSEEYTSWIQVSNLCARCSKQIPSSELSNPKYSIDAKSYVKKVIKTL